MGRQRKTKTWRGGIKRKDARVQKEKGAKRNKTVRYANEAYASEA